MKKLLFIIGLAAIIGCSNEKSPEFIAIERVRDSLTEVNAQRDETINEFIQSMNEIEANLEEIKEKEKIISVSAESGVEFSEDQKDKINEDIQMLYDLLIQNKKKVSQLQRSLSNSDIKISELQKMIDNLSKDIENKNTEIFLLKDKLAEMNIEIELLSKDIDSLTIQNVIKDEEIKETTDQLNVAYYAIGSKKELLEQKVITKDGGFVGLGKIVKLMQDFNKDYFTKVDIREIKEIDLNFTEAKLVTTHPASSYKFEGTNPITKLVITDYEEFWSASKYLVIMVQ